MKTFRHQAFTLAEVLITLGVIGVVAALSLPVITQNVQKYVLKNQFKKVYSVFQTAILDAQQQMGGAVSCSYWDKTPAGNCKAMCVGWNEYGSCNKWTCDSGEKLPANFNAPMGECKEFYNVLFNNSFKVLKFCDKNALAKGCLTNSYRGTDKVKKEQNSNPDYVADPGADFSDSNIKNKYSAWILNDGTLIIKYGTYLSATPLFTVDVNGHKGPNKWGYDMFTFQLKGDESGIKRIVGVSYATEKGGVTTSKMISDLYKK